MRKISLKTFALLGATLAFGHSAGAMPQLPGGPSPVAKTARLAHSPLPPRLRLGADILQIRDVRQMGGGNGGGCWSHCFNAYDECVGTNDKNLCVVRVKTCMETCDRLSGLANPTQR